MEVEQTADRKAEEEIADEEFSEKELLSSLEIFEQTWVGDDPSDSTIFLHGSHGFRIMLATAAGAATAVDKYIKLNQMLQCWRYLYSNISPVGKISLRNTVKIIKKTHDFSNEEILEIATKLLKEKPANKP